MQEISVSRADISLLRFSRWIRLTKSIYNNNEPLAAQEICVAEPQVRWGIAELVCFFIESMS